MRNKIFSFLITISVLVSFTGCGMLNKMFHKNSQGTEVVFGTEQNMYQTTHEYTAFQLDSMCTADAIPSDFNSWIRRAYSDYETNQSIVRYMYVKEFNDNFEMIYIVTQRGEMYVVSKRKVVSE